MKTLVKLCLAWLPMATLNAFPQESLQDHIKGAIIGSALGGAFGRVTSRFETRAKLQKAYGKKGLTSFRAFKKTDWLYDLQNNQFAPLSHDSMLSIATLESLIYGRIHDLNKQSLLDLQARKMIALLGDSAMTYDPYFNERGYRRRDKELARVLSARLQENISPLWPTEASQEAQLTPSESDATGLARVWPYGLIFFDNTQIVEAYAHASLLFTHRHPAALSAGVALAAGVAHALKGCSPEEIVEQMAQAAEQFEVYERIYKPEARKISSFDKESGSLISKNSMFTSDMIRYARYKALEGCPKEEVIGTHKALNALARSPDNFLLGYEADEAVAATVYIFMRNPQNLKAALIESAYAGNSSLIGSLTGALVGAHSGFEQLYKQHFDYEVEMLEKINELQALSNNALVAIQDTHYPHDTSYTSQEELIRSMPLENPSMDEEIEKQAEVEERERPKVELEKTEARKKRELYVAQREQELKEQHAIEEARKQKELRDLARREQELKEQNAIEEARRKKELEDLARREHELKEQHAIEEARRIKELEDFSRRELVLKELNAIEEARRKKDLEDLIRMEQELIDAAIQREADLQKLAHAQNELKNLSDQETARRTSSLQEIARKERELKELAVQEEARRNNELQELALREQQIKDAKAQRFFELHKLTLPEKIRHEQREEEERMHMKLELLARTEKELQEHKIALEEMKKQKQASVWQRFKNAISSLFS